MFQLIVAVISIALVAALAIASIFYGGEAFTKSSEKAVVTTLINQGQQIAGAAALYKTDSGVSATSITDLDGSVADSVQYLASVPAGAKVTNGNAWEINGNFAEIDYSVTVEQAADLCAEVVKQGAGACIGDEVAGYTGFRFAL